MSGCDQQGGDALTFGKVKRNERVADGVKVLFHGLFEQAKRSLILPVIQVCLCHVLLAVQVGRVDIQAAFKIVDCLLEVPQVLHGDSTPQPGRGVLGIVRYGFVQKLDRFPVGPTVVCRVNSHDGIGHGQARVNFQCPLGGFRGQLEMVDAIARQPGG